MKMKYKNYHFRYSMLILMFAFTSTSVFAQSIKLKFLDAKTEKVIQIEQVTLFKDLAEEPFLIHTERSLKKGVYIELEKRPGKYEIFIHAEGYHTMEDRFLISENEILNEKAFHLDPVVVDERLQLETMLQMKNPAGATFVGYLTDENGAAISGVAISTESGLQTISDEDGFYKLFVPYTKEEFYDMEVHNIILSKPGYVTATKEQIIVYPNGVTKMNFKMLEGSGEIFDKMNNYEVENGEIIGKGLTMLGEEPKPLSNEDINFLRGGNSRMSACQPNSITVKDGCNCGATCPCFGTVHTLTLENYTAQVLDDEWVGGWSNLSGSENSFRAAAVAVRTFAAFRERVPRSSSFDIAACTCDQAWTSSEPLWATQARNATSGIVLKVNGVFQKAEYSSENNNLSGFLGCNLGNGVGAGCGNGNVKEGIGGGCIADPVGTNWPQYGHGRNMSQFGSIRWASGLAIGFWCQNPTTGPPHTHGTKNWNQMLSHYYPAHTYVDCNGGGTTCLPVRNINGNIPTGIYEASSTINSNGIVLNGRVVTFKANSEINLGPNFEVKLGGTFTANMAGCSGPFLATPNTGFETDQQSSKDAETRLTNFILRAAPNPFQESSMIEYEVVSDSKLNLFITNEFGKVVRIIEKDVSLKAGIYNYEFKRNDLAPGLYYCIMQSGQGLKTIKLMML